MKQWLHRVVVVCTSVFLSFNLENEIAEMSIPIIDIICMDGKTTNNLDEAAFSYIDSYKDLAIVEMYRSGIPASIILAQGLHESNYGMSPLALNANNHFGIKCKSYWFGEKYYHKDDDFDNNGKLLDSCFRSYGSSIESYVDHSNFLMTSKNYEKLFNFERTDYQSWAWGLKECGYATDPNYAQKLIHKIEKYYLSQFDTYESPYRTLLKY